VVVAIIVEVGIDLLVALLIEYPKCKEIDIE
jgi:hypothetical protein